MNETVQQAKDNTPSICAPVRRDKDILQHMIDSAKNIHLVYLDRNFNFVRVNQAYADTCGFKPEEMIGKNHFALYPHDENEAIFKRVRDTGMPAQYHDKPFTFPDQPERGITYWDWTLEPVIDNSGKVIGLIFSLVETTARKRAEEALKEAQAKLREYAGDLERQVEERSKQVSVERERFYNMLENLPVMVCLITTDYKILFANRMFREKFGEAKGRFCYDHIGCASAPCSNCDSMVPLQTGKPHHWTASFPNGMYVDAHDFPFTDVDGTKMILEANIDITERVNLQKQLQEKERLAAIGATAGMVGHDIRNPLQSIMSDTYLLRDELASMPDSQTKEGVIESIDNIERNISYINKIIADLQDYSRTLKLEYANANLYDLVISAFRPIDIPDNVSRSIEIDPAIRFKTDSTLFTRILSNLVINAVQAMPDGGKITVKAMITDSKVSISVEDTGIGIPEHVKPKLFTPMMTTKAKGQGLGLAVVKRLTEAMNGTISFESEEGKGTKFMIELPISQ